MPDNKIMYGLRNVHYAIVTETVNDGVTTSSYGTVKAWPGAVNISLSPEGSQDPFYADDSTYAILNSNSGYTGTFESAVIPEDVLKAVLGQTVDEDTGLVCENKDDTIKSIALMFEFQGDAKKRRFVFYRVNLARPEVASETIADSIEPVTQSVDLTATPRPDDGLIKAYCNEGDTSYASFYDAVVVPSAESAGS